MHEHRFCLHFHHFLGSGSIISLILLHGFDCRPTLTLHCEDMVTSLVSPLSMLPASAFSALSFYSRAHVWVWGELPIAV